MDNINNPVPIVATNKADESVIFMRNRVCHIEESPSGNGCIIHMIDGKELLCEGFTMQDLACAIGATIRAAQITP